MIRKSSRLFEANEDTNPATANTWGAMYDSYFLWLHSTLTVQSTPPTGVTIGSTMGEGYPTNYTIPGAECPTNVNLQAPATDPAGYTFSEWTVNGTAQTAGLKTISFVKTEPTTAVAQYIRELHADGAVHAADRGEHRFEHRRRRDDELHGPRDPAGNEREPRGAGDGPDRVRLLAVDGERDAADQRAEVHYVRDDRRHDRGGAVHAERLCADRAIHAAGGAGHRLEHGAQRHDGLHDPGD